VHRSISSSVLLSAYLPKNFSKAAAIQRAFF
jgi:hypothetical protein